MKIAYASYGDFSLKPYVHYLYAKHEHPNTPLYVYDDKFHKVTTKEEIENSDYIWFSFKDYGDTLPKNFDEKKVFCIDEYELSRHDLNLIKAIEEYGVENCGNDSTIKIFEANEPYYIFGGELSEIVMTPSSIKWQGQEMIEKEIKLPTS